MSQCALYILIFTLLGTESIITSPMIVMVVALLLGLRCGLIMVVVVGLVLNPLLMRIFAGSWRAFLTPDTVGGTIVMTLTALVLGWLHNLSDAYRRELQERQAVDADLRRHRERLEELVKERTAELEEAHERLRQAQKMEAIGQLAGGVAHDFNNILGSILGAIDLIRTRYTPDDPQLARYIGIINDSSLRAAELTRQLLAFARKGRYEMVPVDVHELIEKVVTLLEHTITKKIRLERHLQADQHTVLGDPAQLQNAILNLAVNGRDAMPDGGELTFTTETVDIDAHYLKTHPNMLNVGKYVRIAVTDTGIGMSDTIKSRVFEPFFTTKEAGKGTGLGLAGVYGTAKSHNGSVEVYSEPGKGTAFKLYLPIVESADRQDADETTSAPAVPKGLARILLVDDEQMIREVAQEILQDLGYEVVTCNDGQEAVEYYRQHFRQIELVIIDLIMPKMDGGECFAALRAINPLVKVLVSSGYAANGNTQKLLDAGAVAFIQKPFTIKHLSETVARALGAQD